MGVGAERKFSRADGTYLLEVIDECKAPTYLKIRIAEGNSWPTQEFEFFFEETEDGVCLRAKTTFGPATETVEEVCDEFMLPSHINTVDTIAEWVKNRISSAQGEYTCGE